MNYSNGRAEAVLSVLKPLIAKDNHWPSTMTIKLVKSGGYYVGIATTESSDGTVTETYSDAWPIT